MVNGDGVVEDEERPIQGNSKVSVMQSAMANNTFGRIYSPS